jgi:nucleoside-diphosphate-sugar epimerase
MDKQVILVTGCSGRIGSRIAERFKDPSYQVVGLDIIPLENAPKNFEYVNMDISSDESVRKALAHIRKKYGSHITSVLHLAAYYNFTGGLWEKYEMITVRGTERLITQLQDFEVEQFLFSSTMLVHDPCLPGQKIKEADPLVPSWEYPRSKIETEAVMHQKRGKIPILMMRIAGCYDDECHSIPISNQIQRIYEGQFASHVFPGDITHGTSFLHLDDLIDALWLAVQKRSKLPPEAIFLVGEDSVMSYDEVQKEISRLLFNKDFKTIRVPKWFAKMGAWVQNHAPFMPKTFIKPWMIDLADEHYDLDISKIKKALGWQPKHTLKESLPVMIKILKKDPLGWYRMNMLTPPSSLGKKCSKGTCS